MSKECDYDNCIAKSEIKNIKERLDKMDMTITSNITAMITQVESNRLEAKKDREFAWGKIDEKISDVDNQIETVSKDLKGTNKLIIGLLSTSLITLIGGGVTIAITILSKL